MTRKKPIAITNSVLRANARSEQHDGKTVQLRWNCHPNGRSTAPTGARCPQAKNGNSFIPCDRHASNWRCVALPAPFAFIGGKSARAAGKILGSALPMGTDRNWRSSFENCRPMPAKEKIGGMSARAAGKKFGTTKILRIGKMQQGSYWPQGNIYGCK